MSWARLQSNWGASAGPNGTVAYTSNLSLNSKLLCGVVVIGGDSSDDIASVKDGAGNAMTLVTSAVNLSYDGQVSLFAMDTPSGDVGGAPTLTATTTGSNFGVGMLCQEVSGLAVGNTLAAMVDGTAGTNQSGGSSSAASGSYSSTAAGEYLVALCGIMFSSATITDASSYTPDPNEVVTGSGPSLAFNYKSSSNGAESATFALSASSPWSTILVAFKLASGGTALASPPPVVSPSPAAMQAASW
jgi:hypothetical protein